MLPHRFYIKYLLSNNSPSDVADKLSRHYLPTPSLKKLKENKDNLFDNLGGQSLDFLQGRDDYLEYPAHLFKWTIQEGIDKFFITDPIFSGYKFVHDYPLNSLRKAMGLVETPSLFSRINALAIADYNLKDIIEIIKPYCNSTPLTVIDVSNYLEMYFNLEGLTEIDIREYIDNVDTSGRMEEIYSAAIDGPHEYFEVLMRCHDKGSKDLIKVMNKASFEKYMQEARYIDSDAERMHRFLDMFLKTEEKLEEKKRKDGEGAIDNPFSDLEDRRLPPSNIVSMKDMIDEKEIDYDPKENYDKDQEGEIIDVEAEDVE